MSKSKSPTEWLDELLIKHCPDLTDVQHIKLRQAILNQVEAEKAKSYKEGYAAGGVDTILRHEKAAQTVRQLLTQEED